MGSRWVDRQAGKQVLRQEGLLAGWQESKKIGRKEGRKEGWIHRRLSGNLVKGGQTGGQADGQVVRLEGRID